MNNSVNDNKNEYSTNINYEPINTIEFHPDNSLDSLKETENANSNSENIHSENNILLPKVLKNNILNSNKTGSKTKEAMEVDVKYHNTSGSIKSLNLDNE